MAAQNTDRFTQVGNPGTATTLAAPGHSVAGTSITVGSTSNWPTVTGAIFAMDTVTLVNGIEVRDVGSYTEWEGVVTSSTTVGSMVLRYGTDQNYPSGSTSRVYIPVASSRENRLVDGILVQHNQDGTHGPVTADSVSTDTITEKTGAAGVTIDGLNIKDSKLNTANSIVTSNYTDASVTESKLAATAITLGSADLLSNFTSTSVGSDVDVTGLSVTFTAPSNSRRIEVTLNLGTFANGNTAFVVKLKEGSTELQRLDGQTLYSGTMSYSVVPTAGSHTYKVSIIQTGAGTMTVRTLTQLLVKAI